ncbi:MAG: polysaccharide pyruvyl transferase CsaB [Chloroflexi bacterium]|nr:polysaccharide pyruvyl transferase CsaB [Chloroflexota bacterium]
MARQALLAGYYGFGNTGDEAILAGILQQLRKRSPNLGVVVVSGDPLRTVAAHQVQAVHWQDVTAITARIRESDLALLGGGGLFHDYWGAETRNLLTGLHAGIPYYAGFPLMAWLLDKPCILWSVGVGPLASEEGRRLTRIAFELADEVTVRDEASRMLLRELGVHRRDIEVTPDPAFVLDGRKVDSPPGDIVDDPYRPLVGICLRYWAMGEQSNSWQEEVAAALDEFHEQVHCRYVFIPFQVNPESPHTDDFAAARAVRNAMRHRREARLLRLQPGLAELEGLLAQCRLLVGMRLHSLVFAARAGVPLVGLAYDPKVRHLLDNLGMAGYSLPIEDLDRVGLLGVMQSAWQGAAGMQRALRRRSGLLAGTARLDLDRVAQWASGRRPLPPRRPLPGDLKPLLLERFSLFSEAQEEIIRLSARLEEGKGELESSRQAVVRLDARLEQKAGQLRASREQAATLKADLDAIYRSRAWRLASLLWGIRRRLSPPGSRSARLAGGILAGIRHPHRLGNGLKARLIAGLRRMSRPPGAFRERYSIIDNSQVILFADDPACFPEYPHRRRLAGAKALRRVKVTLVAAVKDEAAGVDDWMRSVCNQARLPDEIVIVDGGSSDGTLAMIENWRARCPVPLSVFSRPGANIACSRNYAIEHSRYEFIAVTDCGSQLDANWLLNIVAPFECEPDTRVVAGWSRVNGSGVQRLFEHGHTSNQAVDPQTFLPSSRSFAFQKPAWAEVGGYPEWLTMTGEDTYFDLELKRQGGRWAFVPQAVVAWDAPGSIKGYLEKLRRWAEGDGESGVHAAYYWRYALRLGALGLCLLASANLAMLAAFLPLPVALLLPVGVAASWLGLFLGIAARQQQGPGLLVLKILGQAAQVAGFLRGAARRDDASARRFAAAKGAFFILAGVPLDDTGGGSRGTQLARELVDRGYVVVYIHKFPKQESRDLNLAFSHPNLLSCRLGDFDWREFISVHGVWLRTASLAALVEFPLADFIPLLEHLRAAGARLVYDAIDDWATSLGGTWYDPQAEREVVSRCHVLAAVSPRLAVRLRKQTGRKVTLLPNAVDRKLFDCQREWPRPAGMPLADRVAVYSGALWGEWFDWDLLVAVALENPDLALVVIGDYRGQCPHPPANLHFLGLLSQREIPAYLQHADLALIPWKAGAIANAASPLKLYEYLAMGCPALATRLEPLGGIPGVTCAADGRDFVRLAGELRREDLERDAVEKFIERNDWRARVSRLLSLTGQGSKAC